MSIKKIIVVDNEEGEAGSIGSEGSKGKEAASPLFSGCCPRIVSLSLWEGAQQGRIGHQRYERQMRKAEKCVAYVWEAREPDRE